MEDLMVSNEEKTSISMRATNPTSRPTSFKENEGKRQIRKALLGSEQTLASKTTSTKGWELSGYCQRALSQGTVKNNSTIGLQ